MPNSGRQLGFGLRRYGGATVPHLLAPFAGVSMANDNLTEVLTRLYADQLALTPDNAYLRDHARPPVVRSQVAAFRWYSRFLPSSGAILDWGCNHAPDTCLLRASAGDRYELHACDFGGPERFAAFSHFAQMAYSHLSHAYLLPYADWQFDAVVASGVLEHAAMDYESLKELYRVLKPGGVLLITYLPNRWSVREWLQRNIHRRDYHRRRYGLNETRRLLPHFGFEVLDARYQVRVREDWVGTAARVLGPVAALSSVLCFAARKVMSL